MIRPIRLALLKLIEQAIFLQNNEQILTAEIGPKLGKANENIRAIRNFKGSELYLPSQHSSTSVYSTITIHY